MEFIKRILHAYNSCLYYGTKVFFYRTIYGLEQLYYMQIQLYKYIARQYSEFEPQIYEYMHEYILMQFESCIFNGSISATKLLLTYKWHQNISSLLNP